MEAGVFSDGAEDSAANDAQVALADGRGCQSAGALDDAGLVVTVRSAATESAESGHQSEGSVQRRAEEGVGGSVWLCK